LRPPRRRARATSMRSWRAMPRGEVRAFRARSPRFFSAMVATLT
jgi:hypothetical protein